jgi:iron complex outermembrane receptor protein
LIGKNSWIGTAFWFLDYYKDIPSLMNDYNPGESSQNDRNVMYSVYYKYARRLLQFKIQSGGFYNMVDYVNPMPEQSGTNSSYSLINIAELNLPVHKRFDIGLILEQKYETARSANYPNNEIRNILSAIVSARYHSNPLTVSFNLREELVDGSIIPVVFSGGLDFNITSEIALKTQLSKNYSLPTMNDLYWENDGFSAGNPDLKPETGWSYEGGIYYNRNRNEMDLNASVVGFNNKINNWIRWVPVSSNFWMPLNVQKGQSRGIEAVAGIRHNFQSFGIGLTTRYGYTNAVILKSGEIEMQEGQQMWYVPEHNANISFSITHRFLLVDYTQSIVGKRTYDNAEGTLEPYTTGNILLKSQLPLKSTRIELIFSICNIWNAVYQVKRSYAMPLRQYMVGLKFMFNNK